MNGILEQLNRVRGVGGSLLLSGDGLCIAAVVRSDVTEDDLSASLGSLLENALSLCGRLELPNPGFIQLQGEDGGLLLLRTGPGFLAVLTDPQANLALLQLEIKPFVKALAERMAL